MRRKSTVWTLGGLAALALVYSAPAGKAQQDMPSGASLAGLEDVFAPGVFLEDRNGDGLVDFINARIVLPADPAPEEVAAAANIAARLGFESSAFTPGLGVLDVDITPGPETAPLFLVGRSNRWVGELEEQGRIELDGLTAGQGLFAIVSSPFGGADAVVVAGADPAGTLYAANSTSARLPYLWQLRSDTISSVMDDVEEFLGESRVDVDGVRATEAVYEAGREQVSRLVMTLDVADPGNAAEVLDELAADHRVGQARFTDRRAVRLSYYGAGALDFQLPDGNGVVVDRFGPPYKSRFPENPWQPKAAPLNLTKLYTTDGLLGDSRGDDMIPDESETVIVIGSGAGPVLGAVDLAARIGLETTGLTLPIAFVDREIEDPSVLPNPVLIGPGDLAASLPAGTALEPGEGVVEIVPGAFGDSPAVRVLGGDAAGLDAAAAYLAGRLPSLWETRRGEVDFTAIEEDARAFLRSRSSAGQAARALVHLDDLSGMWSGGDITSLQVDVFLEEASAEVGTFLEERLREQTGVTEVSVTAASRYGPVTVFDEELDLGWEVDELRERFTADVVSRVSAGDRVEVEVLVSEPPELRMRLHEEFESALREAGATETRVRVISAYKQGFSWLADYVLPAVQGEDVGRITVRFPTAHYPANERWYGQDIRWLQEIFPIDWILARELGIDVDDTEFVKVDEGPVEYEVEVTDDVGRVLHEDRFAPRFTTREYFPYVPTAKIHYTTGGFRATVNGEEVADVHVRTDPERLWDYYQHDAQPRMFDFAREYTRGDLSLENQPFFRDFFMDIRMSEPDFRLDLDEELISSMDSLHEDLTFSTIDFWGIFSGQESGSREVAPGRLMPMIHPTREGPPEVRVTLVGNAVPHPEIAVKWTTRDGAEGERRIGLTELDISRPRVTSVTIRAGAESVERLTASVDAEDFETARTVGRMVEGLAAMQAAGALRTALGYSRLDELALSARIGNAAIEESVRPVDPALLPQPGAIETIEPTPGERFVTWDHVIGPEELEEELIPRLQTFPEFNAYVAGRTYRGRNVWAMDVMLPHEAELFSQAKASALKPVLFLTTRQHSNEVSATSGALRFMELVATDPDYRKYLDRMNIVYHPMENPDGAANHYEFHKLRPTFILHGGYWSSVGRDVGAYIWDDDPLLPEALVRRQIYYRWLPDVYMNPHGYPSHEWVHQFAGYKVPWFLAFWIPRGYHINLHHIDDPNYPDHKPVGLELRERIIEEVQGVPDIRAANERLVHRFEKYARRYQPDPFRLEIHDGMNILFDYSYSFQEGGSFSDEIYVSSMWKRPDPNGSMFLERHPQITVLDLGCDMPDETAGPEWMEEVAARGQFGYLMSVVKLLYESDWEVQRFEEDFTDGVRLSLYRPRPVKAARRDPDPRATSEREGLAIVNLAGWGLGGRVTEWIRELA